MTYNAAACIHLMHQTNTSALDLQLLRCLAALVETGSVFGAAGHLGLSQPATSHALARLRRLLDDPLLVRSGRGMSSTPRARELAGEARAVLDRVAALLAPSGPFDAAAEAGPLVISAPEYVEHLLSPHFARLLQEEVPQARLRVRPPDPPVAERHLQSGELDLRLGWVQDPSPAMRSRLLFTDGFVCLVRQGHPAAKGELTLEQYAGLTHIRAQAAVPSTANRLIDKALGKVGSRLRVPLVVPSHLTIGRVVASSDYVATVPRCIARTLVKHLALRMLPSPVRIPTLRVAMYWHERVHRDPRNRWLRAFVLRAVDAALDRAAS